MWAVENVAYLAACNHSGREDQVVYAGGSCIVDPRGNIIVEAGEDENTISIELDPLVQFLGSRSPLTMGLWVLYG